MDLNKHNSRVIVLVIDDDIIQRMLIAETLKNDGFDIMEAENGLHALALLKECSGDSYPRIILTDLHMPEMDGYEFIVHLRKNELHYTYIIVLTSDDDPDATIRCLSLGADDFVHKPIRIEELKLRLQGGVRVMQLENYQQMISSLAKLAEYRSEETGYHLERVEHYTRILGHDLSVHEPGLQLTTQMAEDIALVSPLHDIGKVAITDNILHKPARLTGEEFEAMKEHAVIGGKLFYDLYKQNKNSYN